MIRNPVQPTIPHGALPKSQAQRKREYPDAKEDSKNGGDGSPQLIVNMWAMIWGSKWPTPGKLCESTWWVSGSGLCVTSCTRAMWNIVQFNQERCDWVYCMTQLKCSQHLVLKDIHMWLFDYKTCKCSEWNWKTYGYHTWQTTTMCDRLGYRKQDTISCHARPVLLPVFSGCQVSYSSTAGWRECNLYRVHDIQCWGRILESVCARIQNGKISGQFGRGQSGVEITTLVGNFL